MSHHPADQPAFPQDNPAWPKDRPSPKRRLTLPKYRLVLLQDTGLDLMFIVRTIMELTRLCRAEATHKMWEAHHCGRSVLLTTYRERAELYAEQFVAKGLKVSIEPQE